ncbi:DNA-processing protein DprA [Arcobacter sp. FWKO B]|uniref:DNA-processing protein DprA n=1 Tax=Arcobacter sp. FWKO B TaxID=2593672 RepID=UPI0018A5E79B|nr:DNA-processing protein DprA [Arcobacter sp. FWKO B]QOG13085.1 DNA-processing protein DprA [Arcobacter sp. FWKO B]
MISKTYINQLQKELYYIGNLELLQRTKVSVVGTRKPIKYTQIKTSEIVSKLAQRDVVIVSGAAMGVDAIAHSSAKTNNTIAVVANGLDIRYPSVNKKLIEQIEKDGLMLSPFEAGHQARAYNFVQRNELVVGLGDVLIVTQADLNSGSMRSVEFALKMDKKIYVLPHRLEDSEGTNYLLKNNLASAIYNIDEFVSIFGNSTFVEIKDEFLEFCKKNPTYDEAVEKFGSKVFEYELLGKIEVKNGLISHSN